VCDLPGERDVFINPVIERLAMKMIMIVPCENEDLVEMIGRQVSRHCQRHRVPGRAFMMASAEARIRMISASTMYMTPMRL